ncbi:hypothetical protein DLJ59_25030 [Micromonospora inaquosa]|uniref:Uncharacterized protein n=3 Tax=Micromonospora TaxID=1873 RepID=A0A3N9WUS0_9ACTN|nr:hypothetical protein DLJ59_25030 [Micromonospora inaquosa]RQX04490.1 hypothetical protein DLJ58_27545 [Micromonospora arida]
MAEDVPATDAGTPTPQRQALPDPQSASHPSAAAPTVAVGARPDASHATTPEPQEPSLVGRQAMRVFRSARRRRLAMPADQRPRLSRGLIAELVARGWDVPAELRPVDTTSPADSENPEPG